MRPFLLLPLVAAMAPAAQAAPDTLRLQLATGTQYSSGEYGDLQQTDAWVVPFYARLGAAGWSLQVSVPWVRVTGPQALSELLDDDGGFGSNGGGGGSGGGSPESESGSNSGSGSGGDDDDDDEEVDDPDLPGSAARAVSGLGDSSISVGYSFDSLAGSPAYLQLRGRVRLPTGSEREGLGTGATDYVFSSELGVAGSQGGAYVSAGRRLLGEVAGLQRQDGWQAGAGAWWNLSPRTSVGISYDWREASLPGAPSPSFIEAYAAWYLNDVWKLEINGGAGLSDASADYAAGFTLSWRNVRAARSN